MEHVINSFLIEEHDSQIADSRELFTDALRVLYNDGGSNVVLELLESLQDDSTSVHGEKEGGVSEDFLDSLERVSLDELTDKEHAECPICTNKYSDDEYPLLVRLPCGTKSSSNKLVKGHIFDLQCIGPWLKVNPTCPLCRCNMNELKRLKKEQLEKELEKYKAELSDEEEEDDWDVYG